MQSGLPESLKGKMKPVRNQTDERLMKYSDNSSMAALWWKVVFLLPIWGFIPAVVLGSVFTRLGLMFNEIGYLFVVFAGVAYFLEDVLKRKFKIADGVLYFGYRRFPLHKLKTLSVGYESEKIIPRDLIFTFQDGYILPFELSRIDAKDVQYIVKYVDSHYPHCSVDTTLRTLARCQELGPQMRSALITHVELPYHTQRVLSETFKGFMNSLASWSRMGPLVLWAAFSPFWLMATFVIYGAFKPHAQWSYNNIAQQMSTFFYGILGVIANVLQKGATGAAELASQPIVGAVAGVVTTFLVVKLIFKLNEPNLIVLDEKGINFLQSYKWIRYKLSTLDWSDIVGAQLARTSEFSQPDQWKIVLSTKNGKSRVLEYGALEPRGRADLYDRLKHYAPACPITPELAESLMAQQNTSYTELWLQSLTSSPNRENLDPLEPGHTLNESRYEVVMKLGVGGQGAAYLSRLNSIIERQHCQEVVLKETIFPIFVEDSIRRQSLERFEHEARTLNLLSHDRIVKLIDYFVEDHRGYLVLEHIEGKNLRDHAYGKPMREKEVLELALQMCDMLEYLHGRNVIHRDFTPDNLMLERSGTLKLIDFNVAQTQATGMTGTVVGKHAYVPPEQFRGKPVNASDVYAMGCTLFFLLTGHDPEPITQSKVKSKRPEIGTATDTIIRTCTNLKAETRYEDIRTLRDEIKAAIAEVVNSSGDSNAEDDGWELKEVSASGGTIKLHEKVLQEERE